MISMAKDEQMILEIKKHWAYWAFPLLFTILTGGVLLPWFIYRLLRYFMDEIIVTNPKFYVSTGVIAKDVISTPITKINNVYYGVSFFGRILGYGTLYVQSGALLGGSGYSGITNPEQAYNAVENAIEQAELQTETQNHVTQRSTTYQLTSQLSNEFNQSIGGLKLGDTVDQMRVVLGREDRSKPSVDMPWLQNYEYRDVIVSVDNNKRVIGLVTCSNRFKTERGLHEGSTLQQVIDEYGLNCSRELSGDSTLYEYPYNSSSDANKSAIMRFAIKNNIVEYISLRVSTGQERSDILANVRTLDRNPDVVSKQNESSNTQLATTVLTTFHSNITGHDFRSAYNCLSKDFQSEMNYDGWVPGFNTTVSSSVSNVKVESESPNVVILSYVLTAVDNPGGTSQFNGRATLINEGGNWKIDEIVNKAR